MNLEHIGKKISLNWKGLSNGLPFNSYKNEALYFPYLNAEDVIELYEYGKKHNKRVEIYPILDEAKSLLKVSFKDIS